MNELLPQFRILYPQFASVPDETVSAYLDAAETQLDEGTWGEQYDAGVMALACHEMTLQGLGDGSGGQIGNVTSRKVGDVSVTISPMANVGLGDDYYNQTPCGQKYLRMLLSVGMGIVVIPAAGATY